MPKGTPKKTESAVAAETLATVTAPSMVADTIDITNPPTQFRRGSDGLVIDLDYPRKSDGKIDWRKLIDPQYLDFKTDKKEEIEKVYGKKLEDIQPNEVDEKYLTLRLDGAKELAKLRGFTAVRYVNVVAQPGFVSACCEIDWIANVDSPVFERSDTNVSYQAETFADAADATNENTFDFYARYLTTAAYNRAFIRCVRNFLGIYIVGKDEMGPDGKGGNVPSSSEEGVNGVGPYAMLADTLKRRGDRTVPQMVKFLKSKNFSHEGMEEWQNVNDVPKDKIFEIVGLIKNS